MEQWLKSARTPLPAKDTLYNSQNPVGQPKLCPPTEGCLHMSLVCTHYEAGRTRSQQRLGVWRGSCFNSNRQHQSSWLDFKSLFLRFSPLRNAVPGSQHYSVGGGNELECGSHVSVLLGEGRLALRSCIKLDGKLFLLKYWCPHQGLEPH